MFLIAFVDANDYDLDNIHALDPHKIELRWVLRCEVECDDVFTTKKGGSGEMINPENED